MLRYVTFMYYFVGLSVLIRLRNCLAIKTGHIALAAISIVSVAFGYSVFLRHIRPPYYMPSRSTESLVLRTMYYSCEYVIHVSLKGCKCYRNVHVNIYSVPY